MAAQLNVCVLTCARRPLHWAIASHGSVDILCAYVYTVVQSISGSWRQDPSMLCAGVVGHELLEATTPYNLFWPTGHVGSVGVAGALSACMLYYAPPWHWPDGIASPPTLHTVANRCVKYTTSVPVYCCVLCQCRAGRPNHLKSCQYGYHYYHSYDVALVHLAYILHTLLKSVC